jgi:hypothetical protein
VIIGRDATGTLAAMVLGRRSHRPRRFRWLVVLSGAVTGVSAVRNLLLARNEKRFAHLVAQRPADGPR